jgi:hypothetical protein
MERFLVISGRPVMRIRSDQELVERAFLAEPRSSLQMADFKDVGRRQVATADCVTETTPRL